MPVDKNQYITLSAIITDLELCKTYNDDQQVRTAFRFLEDLRVNLLRLTIYLKNEELHRERERTRDTT